MTVEDTANRPVVLLLDGHSIAFRAFYALPPEGFTTSGGQHTNAVYGFLSMLSHLVTEEKPDYIVAAFDEGSGTFRHQEYPAYKAQRAETPAEFIGQVELLREVLHALGIPTVSSREYEADDLIATLSLTAKNEGMQSFICTGDRDSFQLIDDVTTVLYPTKGVSTLVRYTPEKVKERYNVTPAQYPDMAALRGDPSDNLPGVPKVGEKTAAKWLNQYGSLEAILENKDNIKGKVGENLRSHIEDVERNAYLTKMVRNVEMDLSFADAARSAVDEDSVNALFDKLEFGTRLRERVFKAFALSSGAETSSFTAPELAVTVAHMGDVASWLQNYGRQEGTYGVVVAGTESILAGDVDAVAIASPAGQQMVCTTTELNPDDEVALGEWLADEAIHKALHDAKMAAHCLAGRDWHIGGGCCDTLVASYLILPGQRNFNFTDVVERHMGVTLESADKGQLTLVDVAENNDRYWESLAERAVYVLLLATQLAHDLEDYGETRLFHEMEMPLVMVLQRMEHDGIAVSPRALHDLEKDFAEQAALMEREAHESIGDDTVNIGSPKQLQTVLFDQLGMSKTKKTKTGHSTNAESLEKLYVKYGHPFLAAVLGYRAAMKLKTTVTGLINAVGDDERIHTTFNQTITTTGRLSSTDPNLQNIPVRTDDGKRIRDVFVAGKGYEGLLTADYSQIEMRVMAHLSKDEGLIEAFRRGEDLHSYVGSIAFNVPIDEVTPELRRRTKAMSYGLAYGLSPFGLARQLNIPIADAKDFMNNYFARFGGVRDYLHDVVEEARKTGYTETMFGRRRYLPELTSSNRVARENAERAALNAPIQGTAADIIKIAMLHVDDALQEAGLHSRVLLQVHDELVCEVAQGEREELEKLVTTCMDSAVELSVPLEVSTGFGTTWNAAAH